MSENQDADPIPTTAIATLPQQTDTSPEGLMALAINRGIDVAGLEKLMTLASEVRARQAKAAFIEALSAFQAECPTITKTRQVFNKAGVYRYSYAAMEDIKEVIAPLLGQHGLSFTFDTSIEDKVLTVFCIVRHVDGHSEQNTFQVPIGNSGFMSAPQEYASALTYAKRYTLINALGLVIGDEDNDGATPPASEQTSQQGKQQAAQQKQEFSKAELDNWLKAIRQDAEQGMENLQRVWTSLLDADQKKALAPYKDELKQIAAAADAKREPAKAGAK